MSTLTLDSGQSIAFEESGGTGVDVVLLHGLTATRRYVLMGSRAVERSGARVIAFDARGHGVSPAAVEGTGYGYVEMAADALGLMDRLAVEQAVLVGVSMGAHTAAAIAATDRGRVAGMVLITPAYTPSATVASEDSSYWHGLADGLRDGGIEGFIDCQRFERIEPRWEDLVRRATRQRMSGHADLMAVADALDEVPFSRPFDDWEQLRDIEVPIRVIGSLDGPDPGHPLTVAAEWADQLHGASLSVETEGESPLAWRGRRISDIVLEVATQAGNA